MKVFGKSILSVIIISVLICPSNSYATGSTNTELSNTPVSYQQLKAKFLFFRLQLMN